VRRIVFGFLIDKGGVTRYDVIMGQLLLKDFTVLKIMMTAVAVAWSACMPCVTLTCESVSKAGALGRMFWAA